MTEPNENTEPGACCAKMKHVLSLGRPIRVETPVCRDGDLQDYQKVALHGLPRGRFVWVRFCPFCGADIWPASLRWARCQALHDAAMKLSDEGDTHRREGRHDEARAVFAAAMESERAAAALARNPQSGGILYRSAAWLALDAGEVEQAERLAALGLSSLGLDERTAEELRAVLREAWARRKGGGAAPA